MNIRERAKPILFNTEMVRAILNGSKTETRRPIKPQPKVSTTTCSLGAASVLFAKGMECDFRDLPYQKGDILYVRETWADLRGMGFGNNPKTDMPWEYAYKADIELGSDSDRIRKEYGVKWRPSIHMPKEAARIFLEVTEVKVERVRDITENDVRNEGFRDTFDILSDTFYPNGYHFVGTWDSVYAKRGYGWDKNPWVTVIKFKRIERELAG